MAVAVVYGHPSECIGQNIEETLKKYRVVHDDDTRLELAGGKLAATRDEVTSGVCDQDAAGQPHKCLTAVETRRTRSFY